jgi:hypothetical protein
MSFTVVTASDVGYFNLYGKYLVQSIEQRISNRVQICIFICDEKPLSMISNFNNYSERVRFIKVSSPKKDELAEGAQFLYAARFYNFAVQNRVPFPILYLDADMFVRKDISKFIKTLILDKIDVAFRLFEDRNLAGPTSTENGAKVNNGFQFVNDTSIAHKFYQTVNGRLDDYVKRALPLIHRDGVSGQLTCVDQEFLYLAFLDFRDQLKFSDIPAQYNDSQFAFGSSIWHAKGVRKKHWLYLEQRDGSPFSIKAIIYWVYKSLQRFHG